MSSQDADRGEIEHLFSEFAWHADRGNGEAMAQLFSEDGVLCVGGQAFKGREQITAGVVQRSRAAGRKTRHLWSNLRVVFATQNEIVTTAVQLTFEQHEAESAAQLRVNDLFDTFGKSDAGTWQFTHRTIQREMALRFAPTGA